MVLLLCKLAEYLLDLFFCVLFLCVLTACGFCILTFIAFCRLVVVNDVSAVGGVTDATERLIGRVSSHAFERLDDENVFLSAPAVV